MKDVCHLILSKRELKMAKTCCRFSKSKEKIKVFFLLILYRRRTCIFLCSCVYIIKILYKHNYYIVIFVLFLSISYLFFHQIYLLFFLHTHDPLEIVLFFLFPFLFLLHPLLFSSFLTMISISDQSITNSTIYIIFSKIFYFFVRL